MSEWYLVIGFDHEVELNDYKDEIEAWKKKVNPMEVTMKDISGENLGVHLLDLRFINDFDLFSNDNIEVYPYYIFWKLETGFSVGFGFYDKEDMQSKEELK